MYPENWVHETEFFAILDHLLHFYPLTHPKNLILQKWKENLEKLVSFYSCFPWMTVSYMMYGSWDMECNRQNFLSLWTFFCLFTPLTTKNLKNLKKKEKLPGDIIILPKYTINDNRWISNPGVPCSKPLGGGSKVDLAFHPSKVDKMSTRNFWELSGKK